jgi:hypothetical protein
MQQQTNVTYVLTEPEGGSLSRGLIVGFKKVVCRRYRSGRRFGSKNLSTIAKEEAREFVRTYITDHLQPLLDAQIDNAQGLKHLMMRDPKTGKFERITGDAKQIDKALKSKNAFWIYTKDPNVQAFTDLLNRAIDKPAEHIQVAGEGSITIRWQKDEHDTLECDSKRL